MVIKIYYEDPSEGGFIIDCLALAHPAENRHDLKVYAIIKVGPKDTYLNDRKMTMSLYSNDFFTISVLETVPLSEEDKEMKETHPEYFL